MKKRSIALRLGVFALALTLVTTSLSSGTLAKFREDITKRGTFMVAKWNPAVKIKKADNTQITAETFNLKDTLSSGYIKNTTAINAEKLAPGTQGHFTVQVDAQDSEVSIQYAIKMYRSDTVTNKFPDNLVFWKGTESDKDSGEVTLKNATAAAPAELGTPGTLEAGSSNKTTEVTVWWEWPFEDGGDTKNNDTIAGKDPGNFEFTVKVELTQVDPTKAAA